MKTDIDLSDKALLNDAFMHKQNKTREFKVNKYQWSKYNMVRFFLLILNNTECTTQTKTANMACLQWPQLQTRVITNTIVI
jgi:hypothetical protein